MESLIKQIVKEEISKAGSCKTAASNNGSKPRNAKGATRLSALLCRIRSKSDKAMKKDIMLQVKYARDVDGDLKVVKQRSGGGTRFISLPRDATFIEVRDKAMEIFSLLVKIFLVKRRIT